MSEYFNLVHYISTENSICNFLDYYPRAQASKVKLSVLVSIHMSIKKNCNITN